MSSRHIDIVLRIGVAGTFLGHGLIAWSVNPSWIPYLVTVVAMGYSRQAVAIGFVMLAFSGLGANSAIRFAIWITVAALFHKSAVLLIPIAILAGGFETIANRINSVIHALIRVI